MSSRVSGSLVVCAIAVACSTAERVHVPPAGGPDPDRKAVAWRCSDVDLVFFPGEGGRASLRINEERREVALRPGRGGFEYGDDQVAFWPRGGEARLTLPDTERLCYYDGAQSDVEEARLRGVTFRVIGGSPLWVLEISPDKTTMTAPAAIEVPASVPTTDATGARTWSASDDQHTLTIAASPRPCTDKGTGRLMDWTVEVVVDGTPWRGCGEELD